MLECKNRGTSPLYFDSQKESKSYFHLTIALRYQINIQTKPMEQVSIFDSFQKTLSLHFNMFKKCMQHYPLKMLLENPYDMTSKAWRKIKIWKWKVRIKKERLRQIWEKRKPKLIRIGDSPLRRRLRVSFVEKKLKSFL